MQLVTLSLVALFLCSFLHSTAAAPFHARGLPALNAPSQGKHDEHATIGKQAVVATEVDVCSNIGADLIKAGGSAADAIIGASLCVGSIDAFHSGIGGGGFILTRAKKADGGHKVEVIDMREIAPAASNETMYSANSNPNASTIGGLSVGVPGELRGFEYLHSKHGRLPWKQVVAPAVRLNRKGFKVTSQLSVAISQYKSSFLCKQEYWKEAYCANGTAAGLGDHIKRTRYADTLELIGEKGVDAFYSGAIANRTITAIQSTGGIMTEKDLSGYNVKIRRPLHFDYDESKRVWSSGVPSSGAVVLSALKTMSTYNEKEVKEADVNLTTHRLIEATKVGAERGFRLRRSADLDC
jgi:gamma-glutamyltranspeptidase/glutathione hydrolase